ncbi:protein-serine O-palmitoleoyltransferase porcupine [Belonocnema kinseyi]|uniref:protein-serine O-palmitoleoyltransferase porcupine n=1 Tax=Belonocnema kinseyi TaxID=2817044 RepID=UPI00143CE693|nr:protein-serine O-palmitoleoyltransferase porcupine [Belonocnema kinseyi]XP_033219816.1 protein-serine O-palmitoleoyltransferase porcupine [Belonocnema kinseyi]XP_033219817.1 protein-serine O-palmitoleoyltransferase porcupine [Belonocnema kinseyi]XP_033219818.1 protein-serine O-palmitoleoyltransferase porcupine [Belonocnema kinseyi]
MDSMVFYEDDFESQCHDHLDQDLDADYEYEYAEETAVDLYDLCLKPTLQHTVEHLIPLILASFLFKIVAQCTYTPNKLMHGASIILGFAILYNYVPESLYLLAIFTIASYIYLQLPKKYRSGIGVFIPSIFVILYCELSMEAASWHKIRGVVMIAVMKEISIAVDQNESNHKPPVLWQYVGYLVSPVTSIFGPWISFKDYSELHRQGSWNLKWIFSTVGYFALALVFISISNCGASWILTENSGKWLQAYRDALSFRMSHYFVSYTSSSILLLGGLPFARTTITKPMEIEFPRSLVQVVISWNIPMHSWLKTYIFRPGRRQLGKFGGILLTYLASSLLHGLNFQLAAVLLSLGFYTYIEFEIRSVLSTVFDACITSKKCPDNKCSHQRIAANCWWVTAVNLAFSALSIFHLAYLGLMFDTSELQETGYSYLHTIEKWSQLGFASHWIAFVTYCAYFLIR